MEILINENAAGNYIKRCYKNARPDAYGLHNEKFYNILKNIQGQWLEIETEHLFSDQFNTTPIPNVSDNGVRIMMEDVVEIKDDVRNGVMKCRWCYGYDNDNDGACDKCGKTEYLKPLM